MPDRADRGAARNAAWNEAASSTASAESSRIGVRSPPPPIQPLGRDSASGCIEMRSGDARTAHVRDQTDPGGPKARILGRPGDLARGNSRPELPQTVETLTPTFSKTWPCMRLITPPPPSDTVSIASPGFALETTWIWTALVLDRSQMRATQSRSRKASNQRRARVLVTTGGRRLSWFRAVSGS